MAECRRTGQVPWVRPCDVKCVGAASRPRLARFPDDWHRSTEFCYPSRPMLAERKTTIVPDRGGATWRSCLRCLLPRVSPAGRLPRPRCRRITRILVQTRCRRSAPPDARLVIVGLAPGMHGANATGRPFTGDHAGILLYETLHAYGFASQPHATARDDGLQLIGCRITNAVKCLPPENKPTPAEARTCNRFLAADLARVPAGGAVVALGRIAHDATLRALGSQARRSRLRARRAASARRRRACCSTVIIAAATTRIRAA